LPIKSEEAKTVVARAKYCCSLNSKVEFGHPSVLILEINISCCYSIVRFMCIRKSNNMKLVSKMYLIPCIAVFLSQDSLSSFDPDEDMPTDAGMDLMRSSLLVSQSGSLFSIAQRKREQASIFISEKAIQVKALIDKLLRQILNGVPNQQQFAVNLRTSLGIIKQILKKMAEGLAALYIDADRDRIYRDYLTRMSALATGAQRALVLLTSTQANSKWDLANLDDNQAVIMEVCLQFPTLILITNRLKDTSTAAAPDIDELQRLTTKESPIALRRKQLSRIEVLERPTDLGQMAEAARSLATIAIPSREDLLEFMAKVEIPVRIVSLLHKEIRRLEVDDPDTFAGPAYMRTVHNLSEGLHDYPAQAKQWVHAHVTWLIEAALNKELGEAALPEIPTPSDKAIRAVRQAQAHIVQHFPPVFEYFRQHPTARIQERIKSRIQEEDNRAATERAQAMEAISGLPFEAIQGRLDNQTSFGDLGEASADELTDGYLLPLAQGMQACVRAKAQLTDSSLGSFSEDMSPRLAAVEETLRQGVKAASRLIHQANSQAFDPSFVQRDDTIRAQFTEQIRQGFAAMVALCPILTQITQIQHSRPLAPPSADPSSPQVRFQAAPGMVGDPPPGAVGPGLVRQAAPYIPAGGTGPMKPKKKKDVDWDAKLSWNPPADTVPQTTSTEPDPAVHLRQREETLVGEIAALKILRFPELLSQASTRLDLPEFQALNGREFLMEVEFPLIRRWFLAKRAKEMLEWLRPTKPETSQLSYIEEASVRIGPALEAADRARNAAASITQSLIRAGHLVSADRAFWTLPETEAGIREITGGLANSQDEIEEVYRSLARIGASELKNLDLRTLDAKAPPPVAAWAMHAPSKPADDAQFEVPELPDQGPVDSDAPPPAGDGDWEVTEGWEDDAQFDAPEPADPGLGVDQLIEADDESPEATLHRLQEKRRARNAQLDQVTRGRKYWAREMIGRRVLNFPETVEGEVIQRLDLVRASFGYLAQLEAHAGDPEAIAQAREMLARLESDLTEAMKAAEVLSNLHMQQRSEGQPEFTSQAQEPLVRALILAMDGANVLAAVYKIIKKQSRALRLNLETGALYDIEKNWPPEEGDIDEAEINELVARYE
jgi:hypothetical protein